MVALVAVTSAAEEQLHQLQKESNNRYLISSTSLSTFDGVGCLHIHGALAGRSFLPCLPETPPDLVAAEFALAEM